MERDVQCAASHTRADVIASMMMNGFGAVLIVASERRLIGIVSEYDLLASLEKGYRWSDVTAEDIMSDRPVSVRLETSIALLVRMLVESKLIRVPIVEADDRLIGIVARRDVLRACLNYAQVQR